MKHFKKSRLCNENNINHELYTMEKKSYDILVEMLHDLEETSYKKLEMTFPFGKITFELELGNK